MKYQRDISHVLRPIIVVLSLFLLYQVWIKPTYLSPPTPPPVAETPAPALLATQTLLPQDNPGPSDVPQIRLIDPGDAPSAQLSQIKEDLDRGYYKKVESALRKLSKQALKPEPAQRYAAALWNNLGIQQEKFGGIAISVKAFKQAVMLNPKHPIALINLTQAYWGLRDPSLTPEFLQTVIRYAPNDLFPHLALADILIERGNTNGAAAQLKAVETQAASDPNLRPYFQQLSARLPHTEPAQPQTAQRKPETATPPVTLTRTTPKEPAPALAPAPNKAAQKAAQPTSLPAPPTAPPPPHQRRHPAPNTLS